MSIGLVDTSIFCEVVPVPGRTQQREEVLDVLEDHIRNGVTLLLPIATILETGMIFPQQSGQERREESCIIEVGGR
jgi:hypothetical protein